MNITTILEEKIKEAGIDDEGLTQLLSNKLSSRFSLKIDADKTFKQAEKEYLRQYFLNLLLESYGNASQVARKAGISRKHTSRLLKKLKLTPKIFRKELQRPERVRQEAILETFRTNVPRYYISDEAKADVVSRKLENISEEIALSIKTELSYALAKKHFRKEFARKKAASVCSNEKLAFILGMSVRNVQRLIKEFSLVLGPQQGQAEHLQAAA